MLGLAGCRDHVGETMIQHGSDILQRVSQQKPPGSPLPSYVHHLCKISPPLARVVALTIPSVSATPTRIQLRMLILHVLG
jgi:hypothetical protein